MNNKIILALIILMNMITVVKLVPMSNLEDNRNALLQKTSNVIHIEHYKDGNLTAIEFYDISSDIMQFLCRITITHPNQFFMTDFSNQSIFDYIILNDHLFSLLKDFYNSNGTPMIYLMGMRGDSNLTKVLYERCQQYGISLNNIKTVKGNTILHGLARRHGSESKAQFLINEAGMNPFIKNNNGKTAIDLAKRKPRGNEFLRYNCFYNENIARQPQSTSYGRQRQSRRNNRLTPYQVPTLKKYQ